MKLLNVLNVLVPLQYICVVDNNGEELFSGTIGDIPMKYTRLKVEKMMSELKGKNGSELIIWVINNI